MTILDLSTSIVMIQLFLRVVCKVVCLRLYRELFELYSSVVIMILNVKMTVSVGMVFVAVKREQTRQLVALGLDFPIDTWSNWYLPDFCPPSPYQTFATLSRFSLPYALTR